MGIYQDISSKSTCLFLGHVNKGDDLGLILTIRNFSKVHILYLLHTNVLNMVLNQNPLWLQSWGAPSGHHPGCAKGLAPEKLQVDGSSPKRDERKIRNQLDANMAMAQKRGPAWFVQICRNADNQVVPLQCGGPKIVSCSGLCTCPNVSHHPTKKGIFHLQQIWLFWWCETNAQ